MVDAPVERSRLETPSADKLQDRILTRAGKEGCLRGQYPLGHVRREFVPGVPSVSAVACFVSTDPSAQVPTPDQLLPPRIDGVLESSAVGSQHLRGGSPESARPEGLLDLSPRCGPYSNEHSAWVGREDRDGGGQLCLVQRTIVLPANDVSYANPPEPHQPLSRAHAISSN